MTFRRPSILRRTCWLALFAALAFALVPTVSHWLADERGDALAQVCTPQGLQSLTAADLTGDSTGPGSSGESSEHCPFCAPTGAVVMLLTSLPAIVPQDLTESIVPARFLQAPCATFVWRGAQPRAPPVS